MPLSVNILELFEASNTEVVAAIRNGLKESFQNVHVELVTCPDLSTSPFNLPSSGIGGSGIIAEIGGVHNLLPLPDYDSKFHLSKIIDICGLKDPLVFGPGAGPFWKKSICEMMAYCKLDKTAVKGGLYLARLEENKPVISLEKDLSFGLLANLFMSEGLSNKDVMHIRASKRKSDSVNNFTNSIRFGIKNNFVNKPISLGGVFNIVSGTSKFHIMPYMPNVPLKTDSEVNNWLNFFNFSSPITCSSVIHSYDPGFDLRMEHTHGFDHLRCGGHYHYDLTPDDVVYEGYFIPAKKVYRIK